MKNRNQLTDNLFILIKSLTASEKRQFSLFVNRLQANTDSKFLNLFKVLSAQKEYDETTLLKATKISKEQLSNVKAHLYHQILTSLRLNPSKRNIPLQLREQFDFAMILYRKGLYQQCLKLLDKLKSQALMYEEKNLGYEILDLEKIIESQYITRSRSNRADILIAQTTELTYLNNIASQLSSLALDMYNIFLKNGYARTDAEAQEVSEHFHKMLPDYEGEKLGFREKLWLYQSYLWYSFITQDFVACYRYATRWVGLFEKNPHLITVHPVFYIKGNHYVLESLYYLNRVEQFETALDRFEEILGSEPIPEDDNIIVLSFLYVYANKLNLRFMRAQFSGGEELLETIHKKLDRYKDKIDDHHVMVLYYKIACYHFGTQEYAKCIFFLKKIINSKTSQIREDLMCFAHMLNLAAHYQAGLDYRLEALIRSTYNFLIKMNDLHGVQRAVIDFLKGLSNVSPLLIKRRFIELLETLKTFEKDPFERRAFLYLDLISWLESNIYNKPIAQVIGEKVAKRQQSEA